MNRCIIVDVYIPKIYCNSCLFQGRREGWFEVVWVNPPSRRGKIYNVYTVPFVDPITAFENSHCIIVT